jgi:hypothetical protein
MIDYGCFPPPLVSVSYLLLYALSLVVKLCLKVFKLRECGTQAVTELTKHVMRFPLLPSHY